MDIRSIVTSLAFVSTIKQESIADFVVIRALDDDVITIPLCCLRSLTGVVSVMSPTMLTPRP
jgi:hypothetical protein